VTDDPQLVAAVMALLHPFLIEAAKAGAGKVGEATVEGVGKLYTLLSKHFSRSGTAREALERLKETPQVPEVQTQFREVLEQRLIEDPGFRAELGGLVEFLSQRQTAQVTGDGNTTIQISGTGNKVGWLQRNGERS
jgi:hypothetical protein